MHFPVVWRLAGWSVPAHLVFESLGYFIGFRIFLLLRSRAHDSIPAVTRFSLIAAAAVGALLGSKLLVWLQDPVQTWAQRGDPAALLGGKTIVGGLLGGQVAVEWMKRALGETRRTGDLFVIPLCVGMALGRVGCFLGGLDDHTYGNPTSLPWGVDFGDGLRRHPTQLYEVLALIAIATWAWRARARLAPGAVNPLRAGDLFAGFMSCYLAFRLALEWIKPGPKLGLGLSAIQIACVIGLLYHAPHWPRIFAGGANRARPGERRRPGNAPS